jgi:hypothetical protein
VILWHAGLAMAIVWNVFRDPAIDHRLLVAGALIPDAIDLAWGRPAAAHTLLAPVAVLTVVMLATRGRRILRRRLLALPIGMFLHLVLDGVWTSTALLWWPFFGTAFPDGHLLHPWPLVVLEELAGAWAIGWFVWHFGLNDPQRYRHVIRSGRLPAPIER